MRMALAVLPRPGPPMKKALAADGEVQQGQEDEARVALAGGQVHCAMLVA